MWLTMWPVTWPTEANENTQVARGTLSAIAVGSSNLCTGPKFRAAAQNIVADQNFSVVAWAQLIRCALCLTSVSCLGILILEIKTIVRSSYLYNEIAVLIKWYLQRPFLISLTYWGQDKMTAILQTKFSIVFLNEDISMKISLVFVSMGWIDHKSALVQMMVWCWTGTEPLSGPMEAWFVDEWNKCWLSFFSFFFHVMVLLNYTPHNKVVGGFIGFSLSIPHYRSRRDVMRLSNKRSPYLFGVATANRTKVTTPNIYGAEIIARMSDWENPVSAMPVGCSCQSRKRVAIQFQLMNIHVSECKCYCLHLIPKFGDVHDHQNWRLHPTVCSA